MEYHYPQESVFYFVVCAFFYVEFYEITYYKQCENYNSGYEFGFAGEFHLYLLTEIILILLDYYSAINYFIRDRNYQPQLQRE